MPKASTVLLKPGLTDYACARACLAWMLASFAVFFAAKHYGLLDGVAVVGASDGYLAGVLSRFLSQPFYQAMGLSFVGCCAYGVVLFITLKSLVNNLHQAVLKNQELRHTWFSIFVGLPRSIASTEGWRRFIERGASYATSPLRDAATLFPALGFLGTVIGVSIAIGALEDVLASGDVSALMVGLRTAFDTTFIGLCAALVLTILIFVIDTLIAQATALLDEEQGAALYNEGVDGGDASSQSNTQ